MTGRAEQQRARRWADRQAAQPVVGKIEQLTRNEATPGATISWGVMPGTLCVNCGVHPATTRWLAEGGVFALTHGGGSWWCERCCVRADLEYARKQAARVPDLEAKLAELEQDGGA